MADAGSRAWSNTGHISQLWANLSASMVAGSNQAPFLRSISRMGSLLLNHALAVSTRAKYREHWRQWCRFAQDMGWSRRLKPTNASRRLGYFATYCWSQGANRRNRGNQHATITLKLASIKWFHRRYRDLELPAIPRLKILLQGIKRLSTPKHKKQPITTPFLRLLQRTLNFPRPLQRLLWGSISIGYFFMLRRSEYLLIDGSRHFYCLKTRNVFFSDKDGNEVAYSRASSVTIGLEGARNDQYGRRAWRTKDASSDGYICPVQGLYHGARKELRMQTEPHLCGTLSAETVSKALKKTARRAGVPASQYATPSICIGGATALMAGGADRLSIKLLGRWASNCFEEYPRQSAKASTGLAKRMVQQRRDSTTRRAQ